VTKVTRLMLTSLSAYSPMLTDLADLVIPISRRFVWGRLPSQSRLSLTEFGRAVVAHDEDFSRHNPIHRWGRHRAHQ